MNLLIRPEEIGDFSAIHNIHCLAFKREDEAMLVERLRKDQQFTHGMSLVALQDSQVVGHVLFSRLYIPGETQTIKAAALEHFQINFQCIRNYGRSFCIRLA